MLLLLPLFYKTLSRSVPAAAGLAGGERGVLIPEELQVAGVPGAPGLAAKLEHVKNTRI